MIDGVKVKDLKVAPDERGLLMEMWRSDDPDFQKFGQVYVTMVYPGVVKAWHYHKLQTDHFVCVSGMAKVVLHDARENSLHRDSSPMRGRPILPRRRAPPDAVTAECRRRPSGRSTARSASSR